MRRQWPQGRSRSVRERTQTDRLEPTPRARRTAPPATRTHVPRPTRIPPPRNALCPTADAFIHPASPLRRSSTLSRKSDRGMHHAPLHCARFRFTSSPSRSGRHSQHPDAQQTPLRVHTNSLLSPAHPHLSISVFFLTHLRLRHRLQSRSQPPSLLVASIPFSPIAPQPASRAAGRAVSQPPVRRGRRPSQRGHSRARGRPVSGAGASLERREEGRPLLLRRRLRTHAEPGCRSA